MAGMVRHPWADTREPLVFAHRGGSRLAPENTLAAFDRGVREGADGLELDVHLSGDGEVMVCHDASVDRTTDARGTIRAMTSRELASVDAGYRFVDEDGHYPFRGQGFGIPMLRDVVARYPDRRLIIEMKDDDPRLAEATLGLVRAASAEGRVCLGSFHAGVLRHARALQPLVATSAAPLEVRLALYCSWIGLFPPRVRYRAFQVPERREQVNVVSPRFVRAARRAGVSVEVWVVDREEDIRRLLGYGVQGIITDRPDVAVAVVRAWRCQPQER